MILLFFEFPADVWGTVSDWVMIGVTFATAWFLWNTLKSQKEVQNTQNRLLEIEQVRLREDYKPEIKYSRFFSASAIVKPSQYLISIAIRNVSDKAARNIRVIYPTNKNIVGNAFQLNTANTRNIIKGTEYASLHLFFEPLNQDEHKEGFSFDVFYEDLVGTKYKQLVICTFITIDDLEFDSSAPEIIS